VQIDLVTSRHGFKGWPMVDLVYDVLFRPMVSASVTRTEPEPVKPASPTGSEPPPVRTTPDRFRTELVFLPELTGSVKITRGWKSRGDLDFFLNLGLGFTFFLNLGFFFLTLQICV
jgi:hypothetical protein